MGEQHPLPYVLEAVTVFTAQIFFLFFLFFYFFMGDYFMTRDFAFCSSRLRASRALHLRGLSGRFMRLQPKPFLLDPANSGQWYVGADGAEKAVWGFLLSLPWVVGCSQGRDPS